jgi:hypothetical protein
MHVTTCMMVIWGPDLAHLGVAPSSMPAGLNVTFTVLKSPNFLLILTSRLAARG